jgi:primase-polymerase (primpol)-like protein
MTVSSQSLDGTERALFKKILTETKGKKRQALDKKLGRIVREAIEESGSSTLNGVIATKIRERILP